MQSAQNKRYSCSLGGAIAAISSVYRAIPILHSGPGCGMQLFIGQNFGCGFQGYGYIGGSILPGTNTHEQEIVFGGEQRLRETIQSTMEVVDGDFYVVLTGCTADIIGDDIKSIVDDFSGEGRVIYAETAGFKGNSYQGYELAWEAMIARLIKPQEKRPDTVNLFGVVPTQDPFWLGNLMEMERLLQQLGLKVNAFYTNRQDFSNVLNSSGAVLNIFFSPYLGGNMAKQYAEKFDVPSVHFPGIPIGPTATSHFLRKIGESLNLDKELLSNLIDRENETVYDFFNRASMVISGLNLQHSFAVIGDAATVIATTQFLTNDLGQLPVAAVITDNPPEKFRKSILEEFKKLEYSGEIPVSFIEDQREINETLLKCNPSYILGSTLDKEFAKEIHAKHLSISFPVTDKLILSRSYAGYSGCIRFIEDYLKITD